MATRICSITFALRKRWWVDPLVAVLLCWARMGGGVDVKRLGRFVGRRGFRLEVT